MLTFHHTMDPHSLDVKREGKDIGYIAWHRGESVAKIHIRHFNGTFSPYLEISEMEQIVELRKNNFKL